jgi:hypothetical protein
MWYERATKPSLALNGFTKNMEGAKIEIYYLNQGKETISHNQPKILGMDDL